MNLNTITTAPGAAIGAETDTLPAKVAQLPGQHGAERAPTTTGTVVTTAQRVAETYDKHGISPALVIQLQHIQELALAINLQGRYHISTSLMGLSGHQDFSILGKTVEAEWTDKPSAIQARWVDIRPGDDAAMREAHARLANAAADLMALLEEVPA
ncbi:hypothetical protein QHH_11 [Halomonas phage QHHSV-1]|nr:hypothetical protein QHH_11 [Halomonas phage QHHSV-1]